MTHKLTRQFLFTIVAFTLAISFFFTSCSTTRHWRKELEKEWIGKTKKELIVKYGEPYQINTTDSPGNEIYIYKHSDFTPDVKPNNYTKDFFIDKNNLIFKIETYCW